MRAPDLLTMSSLRERSFCRSWMLLSVSCRVAAISEAVHPAASSRRSWCSVSERVMSERENAALLMYSSAASLSVSMTG